MEGEKPGEGAVPVYMRPCWVIGSFCSIVLNTLAVLAALNFAAASMVTPFAGLHIFFNVILAHYICREPVGKRDIFGSVIIIIGMIFVIVFGSQHSFTFTFRDICNLFTRTDFVVYAICMAGILAACIVGSTHYVKNVHLKRLAVTISAGIFGGNTNIVAKAVVDLMSLGISDGTIWQANYQPYMFLIGLIGCAVAQLIFLNRALSQYPAVFVVPTVNAFLITTGSIGGIVIFIETPEVLGAYIAGVFLVVLGVGVLAVSIDTDVALKSDPTPDAGITTSCSRLITTQGVSTAWCTCTCIV